jgi:beta-glucanase (GH16 family)
MRTSSLAVLSAVAALAVVFVPLRAAEAPPWTLAWSDDFLVDGPPDEASWAFETGFVRNDELQWYQPQNAVCRGGLLVIEARRERVRNPNFVAGSTDWKTNREFAEYTSASLTTKGRVWGTYGRFEMRGRIDTRSGLWPAWWTLGDEGEWPDGGEIDMMEYYRGTLLANVAWGSGKRWVPVWDSVKTPVDTLGAGWSDQFHVWRMDWDADWIRLYVDDRLLNETRLADTIDRARKTDPFHHPHYQLLSLAVGGWNGGDPSQTTFPARFEVDWVRVYRPEGRASP